MEATVKASPSFMARMAGLFYLLVFVTGSIALFAAGKFVVSGDAAATATNILAHEISFQFGWAANLLATVCYVVVTALFYEMFKYVNRSLSLTAAFFSLVGCAIGGASSIFPLAALTILKSGRDSQGLAYTLLRLGGGNVSLIFFGFYCLLIGWLILESTFLPRIVGAGMLLASCGWLTFLWPPLAHNLSPYNLLPGVAGEGLLTLWLLVMGVNVQRWKEQAAAAQPY